MGVSGFPAVRGGVPWVADRGVPPAEGSPTDASSYRAHGETMFQIAARWASTTVADSRLKLESDQTRVSGLGTVRYFEADDCSLWTVGAAISGGWRQSLPVRDRTRPFGTPCSSNGPTNANSPTIGADGGAARDGSLPTRPRIPGGDETAGPGSNGFAPAGGRRERRD